MKHLLSSFVLVALALGISSAARAQGEINLLAPGPIKEPLDKLLANFQSKTGTHVKVTYAGGVPSRQQVAAGKGLDVDILFAPFPDVLKTGNIDPKSATVVARVRLALAVKKGAPKPDISTPAAVKRTLLAAKSIVIVDPAQGTLGGEAMDALKKLGLAEQVKPKMKIVEGSQEAEAAVAKGEVELFLGPQVSDTLRDGVDLVGGLPRGVSTPVDAVGFVSTKAKDPKAAKALLQYLKSPEAEAAYKAARMEPAH